MSKYELYFPIILIAIILNEIFEGDLLRVGLVAIQASFLTLVIIGLQVIVEFLIWNLRK